MAIERTFSIIKPDATARNVTGAINAMIEKAGLRIVAQKRMRMSRAEAETFYAVHRARPFFGELVDFMISGPVVVQVLEGENAVAAYRDLMGATDPAKAAPGTIRKAHAQSIGENSVHGSDAADTAAKGNRAVFRRQRNRRLKASARCGFDRRNICIPRCGAIGSMPASRNWATRRSGSPCCKSSSSISCCPATMPWSSRWPAAACRRINGAGA